MHIIEEKCEHKQLDLFSEGYSELLVSENVSTNELFPLQLLYKVRIHLTFFITKEQRTKAT